MRRWTIALLSWACLPACNDVRLEPTEVGGEEEEAWVECTPGPAKVDVLLVVDDSISMVDDLPNLATNLEAIAQVYESSDLDYRIAVTTTSVGQSGCSPEAVHGRLVDVPCLAREGDFLAVATATTPAEDLRDVCRAHCVQDGALTIPTQYVDGEQPRERPWLERRGGRHNLAPGVSMSQALSCLGLVGVSGCGYEAPLQAASLALRRSLQEGEDSYGFLRPDASLFVLFITDEGDCSVNREAQGLSHEALDATCGEDPGECTEAGGVLQCGEAESPIEDPILVPPQPLIDLLAAIQDDKGWVNPRGRVFTSMIGPADCQRSARLRAVVEAFAQSELSLYSVCGEDYATALACVPGPQVPARCVPRNAADRDPHSGRFQPACELAESLDGPSAWTPVPECVRMCGSLPCADGSGPAATHWELPVGADACVGWQTDPDGAALYHPSVRCRDWGLHGYQVLRREPLWESVCTQLTCEVATE